MYESFYGLTDKPFQLNPDPAFYFGSRQHRRAMAYLEYGLHQNEGFIVITGEVGAGKTTLVRNLLDKLDADQVVAAQLVSTQLDADDTLRLVGSAFGLRTKDVDKSDLLLALEAFLVSLSQQGKRALLVVDEAQNLTPRAVEELRMLSNFQLGTHALLQSFLIGQPEFRHILQSAQMQQLRQRVIAACHIGPLDLEDTRGYVEHRLKCVGWLDNPQFQPDVFPAIFAASGGIPRRINSVCDRLLLSGFLAGKRSFTGEEVGDVAQEINDETLAPVLPAQGGAGQGLRAPQALGHSWSDVDLSKLELNGEDAEQVSRVIAGLTAGQLGERLIRLERSMLRLEASNSATLALLQQLVDAVRNGKSEKEDSQ